MVTEVAVIPRERLLVSRYYRYTAETVADDYNKRNSPLVFIHGLKEDSVELLEECS